MNIHTKVQTKLWYKSTVSYTTYKSREKRCLSPLANHLNLKQLKKCVKTRYINLDINSNTYNTFKSLSNRQARGQALFVVEIVVNASAASRRNISAILLVDVYQLKRLLCSSCVVSCLCFVITRLSLIVGVLRGTWLQSVWKFSIGLFGRLSNPTRIQFTPQHNHSQTKIVYCI